MSTSPAPIPPLPPVRRSIIVEASLERCFEVFTAGFDRWWPRTHHTGTSEPKLFILEQKAGGRCYEIGQDGSECDWGRVRVWEPPTRVLIAWHLGPDWKFCADDAKASEVDVRFVRESDARTRVELEHRHIERHGAGAEAIHGSVSGPGGWPGILERYHDAAAPASERA